MPWGDQRPAGHRAWALDVLIRDRWKCQQCGYQGARGKRDVHADHIIPLAQGGTYDLDNGQVLCVPCHGVKTKGEAAQGLQARAIRQPEQETHPGLLARPSRGGG